VGAVLQEINQHGVARMCRLLAVLQPVLASLGAAGGAFRPEAARAFEKARAYYGLLTVSVDTLLKAASDRPGRFTPAEYLALLQARSPPWCTSCDSPVNLCCRRPACCCCMCRLYAGPCPVGSSTQPGREFWTQQRGLNWLASGKLPGADGDRGAHQPDGQDRGR
jgi:hypothetical protein